MAQPTEYAQVGNNNTEGNQFGAAGSDKIAFYGATPVVQRPYTSAVHLSSELATSADFGATQLAAVNEIQATLLALGFWASS